MTLPTSGALTLDAIHVEAGGTTGTQASINDSDIRSIANNIPSAHNPMPFKFWYGAPFSLGSWPTGAGSLKQPINTLIFAWDRNGDGTGEATFEWSIKHDTTNNRIEFKERRVTGLNATVTTSYYYTYTGDVLDNVNNDLADWEFKAEWSVSEIDASDGSNSTNFTTPDDNGYSSGTWYNISASTFDPIYEFTVSTNDPDGNGTITNSKIQGTIEFYIRCTKAGITMPFTTGYDTSGQKTLDLQANAGSVAVIEP